MQGSKQVIADPNEIRVLAAYLQKLSGELKNLKNNTRSKVNQLNQSWRDNEYQKFVQQFENDIKPLERLSQSAEEYSQFLKRKANALDTFNNTR